MNSKTLAALAGLCIAAPAMAQISSIRNDIGTAFVNIAGAAGATRLSSSTATHDDSTYSFAGVSNAGIASATYRVNSNGFVQFGATSAPGTSWVNSCIPAANGIVSTSVAQAICVFWDDMITGATATATNGVWARTGDATTDFGGITLSNPFGGGPVAVTGNVTIIQWQGQDLFSTANPTNINFQLMIFSAPPVVGPMTVYALAVYQTTTFNATPGGPGNNRNDGESATIGYSRGSSGLGTSVTWGAGNNDLGTTFAHFGNYVTAGTSLAFVPTPGAAALLGLGALAAGRRRRA